MIGVLNSSTRGRELIARGPGWYEHPDYYAEDIPDPQENCAACGERDCPVCGDPQLVEDGIA